MIPRIITDTNITFFARGAVWTVNDDDLAFDAILDMLNNGCEDEEALIARLDPWSEVKRLGGGRMEVVANRLFRDGMRLPHSWTYRLRQHPELAVSLLARVDDTVRVEGDEDCPDGLYTVVGVDDHDTERRVYLETEDGFFGFVANTSIKEVVAPQQELLCA
jgi:hypothetical protein